MRLLSTHSSTDSDSTLEAHEVSAQTQIPHEECSHDIHELVPFEFACTLLADVPNDVVTSEYTVLHDERKKNKQINVMSSHRVLGEAATYSI